MRRAFLAVAAGAVALGAAVTVASAATLGGISSADLGTVDTTVSPAFAVYDHFESASTTPLNGAPMLLSPTGSLSDLGSANAPTWSADAGWVVDAHVAEATGTGGKIAYFPFTAQNGYVATLFQVYALNASAGIVVSYDPVAQTGVAVLVQRTGQSWSVLIGTVAAGVFTESSRAALPLTQAERPTGAELRVRIQNGVAIASYGGVDYVSRAILAGKDAGLISLTPNVAAAFHYVSAAKTP